MDTSETRKTRQLVTIVTEALIEHAIIEDLERLGVGGYTITEARGKGHRGVREADWMASGNIRIEIVCNQELANTVVDHLSEHYYRDYAMIMYLSQVAVLRPEKF
ncbi:MAG: P-II family nitrogen regulator [Planctomycetota bacterium]